MTKVLQLNFATAEGKKMMLTVDSPRTDLTTQIVEAAMQEIISTNVFEFDEYPLATAVSARIIERNVTNLVGN